MNPAPLLALSVLLSGVTAYAVVELTRPAAALQASTGNAAHPKEAADRHAAALAALTERVETLEATAGRVTSPNGSTDRKAIEEVVAEYLRKNGESFAGRAADTSGTRSRKDPKVVFEEARADLADPSTSWDDRQAALKALKDADQLDKMIALMEQRAQASPADAEAHNQLGQAYLQKVFGADDLEKGDWAGKADAAFDAALKANPEHWEARFAKAVSLSHWPPVMGKGKVAIQHFEILREQQERSGRKNDEFAQTYLFLGNLYEQANKHEQALEVRRKGVQLFPDDTTLRDALRETAGK